MEIGHPTRTVIESKNPYIGSIHYRLFIVLHYFALAGLIGHALFIPIIIFLDAKELAIFSALSVIFYLVILSVNRKGSHNMALALIMIAIFGYAAAANFYMGWEGGCHYYILALIPILFFASTLRSSMKVFLASVSCIFYVSLYLLSVVISPITNLGSTVIAILNSINIINTVVVFSMVAHFYSKTVNMNEMELKMSNKELKNLAGTDPLTGLWNRRKMMEKIRQQFIINEQEDKPFVLIIMDIDDFKKFNDTYGHECGDFVLVTVSSMMKNMLRKDDELSRWGGEEFLLMLPEASIVEGKIVAEKIRQKISNHTMVYKDLKVKVTMTFGVSVFKKGMEIDQVIVKADQALYKGKQAGRNCVMVEEA